MRQMTSLVEVAGALLSLWLASIVMSSPAQAQCCLGAQDLVAESAHGRFRVEATSLTGTGIRIHGPYRFEMRFSERQPDGTYTAMGVFTLGFDTDDHFSMSVYVSETGNGFLLDTVLLDAAVFLTPDGTTVASFPKADYSDLIQFRAEDDGCFLALDRYASSPTDPRAVFFLPGATLVSPELDVELLALCADPRGHGVELSFLGCLLTYPEPSVATMAFEYLTTRLPADFDGTARWLSEHLDGLRWVHDAGRYEHTLE